MHINRIAALLAVGISAAPGFAQGRIYDLSGLGSSIAAAGDVDGDGFGDLVLGTASAQEVKLVSGRDAAVLFTFTGTSSFGAAIGGGGDANGDGRMDGIVGAPGGTAGSTYVQLFSGRDGSVLQTWVPSGVERIGFVVGFAGDVDGDGFGDWFYSWAVPAPPACDGWRLVSGADGSLLWNIVAHCSVSGPGTLARAGDLDQDGHDDVWLGDATAMPAGAIFALSGRDGSILRRIANPSALPSPGSGFGSSVANLGDIDGDSVPDVAVGAPNETHAGGGLGSVWIFSSASGALVRELADPASTAFGWEIAALGDSNADGKGDLAVPRVLGSSSPVAPGVRILSPADGQLLYAVDLPSGDYSEFHVASAGTVNRDALGDWCLFGLGQGGRGFVEVYLAAAPPARNYCLAKTNSAGCAPAIESSGAPSLWSGPTFVVSATSVLGQQRGILLWGLGRAAAPFGGGTLCILPPLVRTGVQSSSGSPGTCSGTYAFAFDKPYLELHALVPGVDVYAQFWSRDPGFTPPDDIGLTDALQFQVWP